MNNKIIQNMKTKSISNRKISVVIISAFITYFLVSHFVFQNWDIIKESVINLFV